MYGNMTEETLKILEGIRGAPMINAEDTVAKSISTQTGLVAYDLQAPAKNLYPFITPIRNAVPRVGGGTGTATNWRAVLALLGSGFDAMGWVPEGQRSGQMAYNTANRSANYVTIGEEDNITFEAINAARQFEDVLATMVFRLLQKTMLKEENAILGGNATLQLGVPATPTVSAATLASSTLTSATYYVKVVGLTYEGFLNSGAGQSAVGNSTVLANNSVISVPTQRTITGADGKTFTLAGGSSNISAESAGQATVSGTSALAMTVTALQGAVAYAWFIGAAAGTETLQAISTINSYVQSVPLSTGNQSAAAVLTDNSYNNGQLNNNQAYDGLLTTALKPANNAYVSYLATGTAGTGTTLTASGRGSVVEIDTMLQSMWNQFELSPTVLYVNAQELKNITTKVLSNTAGPLLRFETSAQGTGGEYQLTASGVIQFYYNPFAISGGLKIPVRLHPRLPPGTILGWCENLPIQYQSNEVPQVAEVKTRQDYSNWVH